MTLNSPDKRESVSVLLRSEKFWFKDPCINYTGLINHNLWTLINNNRFTRTTDYQTLVPQPYIWPEKCLVSPPHGTSTPYRLVTAPAAVLSQPHHHRTRGRLPHPAQDCATWYSTIATKIIVNLPERKILDWTTATSQTREQQAHDDTLKYNDSPLCGKLLCAHISWRKMFTLPTWKTFSDHIRCVPCQ